MKSKYDWNGFNNVNITYSDYLVTVYDLLIGRYPKLDICFNEDIKNQFTDNRCKHFGSLYCTSTFAFIKFSEFSFYKKDIKTVKMCQELLNSFDKDNVIMACNILIKLKPMGEWKNLMMKN